VTVSLEDDERRENDVIKGAGHTSSRSYIVEGVLALLVGVGFTFMIERTLLPLLLCRCIRYEACMTDVRIFHRSGRRIRTMSCDQQPGLLERCVRAERNERISMPRCQAYWSKCTTQESHRLVEEKGASWSSSGMLSIVRT
jgi:hypothetical protein